MSLKRLYGHRGARGTVPENTLPAFAAALKDGANALEMDVHRTKDGEVVVMHDDDFTRMANDRRRVADVTFEELREIDVGWGYRDDSGARPFAGRGLHAPRLSDVLRAFPAIPINIDIKTQERALRTATMACVDAQGASSRVLLTSFYDDVTDAVIADGYTGPVGLARNATRTLRLAPTSLVRRLLRTHLRRGTSRVQIPPKVSVIRLDDASFIAKAHDLGLMVDYWVVDELAQAELLVARGADGLFTDYPSRLRGLVPSPL